MADTGRLINIKSIDICELDDGMELGEKGDGKGYCKDNVKRITGSAYTKTYRNFH